MRIPLDDKLDQKFEDIRTVVLVNFSIISIFRPENGGLIHHVISNLKIWLRNPQSLFWWFLPEKMPLVEKSTHCPVQFFFMAYKSTISTV